MYRAVFTRGQRPVMHAVEIRREPVVYADGSHGTNVDVPATATVCGLPLGVGSGLEYSGRYGRGSQCPKCWDRP